MSQSVRRGSSPLVRGARTRLTSASAEPRIIPARAGSTSGSSNQRLSSWDHPRSCGEHSGIASCIWRVTGSSPLERGALEGRLAQQRIPGIIPARAGSTSATTRRFRRPGDHPRSCGEHQPTMCARSLQTGSSPLVRGAPTSPCVAPTRHRIIPARAGSTGGSASSEPAAWDHPRSCGEHFDDDMRATLMWGSSPLVRGARPEDLDVDGAAGIIPARAGSTLKNLRNSSMTQSFLFNYQGTSWQSD